MCVLNYASHFFYSTGTNYSIDLFTWDFFASTETNYSIDLSTWVFFLALRSTSLSICPLKFFSSALPTTPSICPQGIGVSTRSTVTETELYRYINCHIHEDADGTCIGRDARSFEGTDRSQAYSWWNPINNNNNNNLLPLHACNASVSLILCYPMLPPLAANEIWLVTSHP